MEKLLTLFLSVLLLLQLVSCQSSSKISIDKCINETEKDNLITKYLTNGAFLYSYNDPNWGIYCDSLIAICPNIAEVYRIKAIPHIKNGDYAQAFLLENKTVELDAQTWMSYRAFLKCIFTKDYEGAIVDFDEAEKLNPKDYVMDHTHFFYRGLCNLELGNYQEAERDLKQDVAIQTNGNDSVSVHFNTLFYLGVLYYETEQYNNAIIYLENSIKNYNQFPDAHYYLAKILINQHKNELAAKYLQIAQNSLEKGYSINEDNVFYANYPHQITLYEVTQEINQLKLTK